MIFLIRSKARYPSLLCGTLLSLSTLLLLPASVTADTDTSSNLISNNPFVSPKLKSSKVIQTTSRPRTTTSNTTKKTSGVLSRYINFKSVAIISEKKYFSIFNRRTNKSFWLTENETIESLRVTQFDPSSQSITISDGINTEVIAMITADDKPINVVSTPKTIASTPNQSSEVKVQKPPTPLQNNQTQKRQPIPRRRVVSVKTKQ